MFSLNDNIDSDNSACIGWGNFNDLLRDIFDVGIWLVEDLGDNWKTIAKNPYLGDKSIENCKSGKIFLD